MVGTDLAVVWISGSFGALLLAVGIWRLLRWHSRLSRCTSHVEGVIEKTSSQRSRDATRSYQATVVYKVNGQAYRLTESFDRPFGPEGKTVAVWIDPDDPSRSRLDADETRSHLGYSSPGFAGLFIAIGALSCVLALLMRFAPDRLHDLLHLPGNLIRRLKAR